MGLRLRGAVEDCEDRDAGGGDYGRDRRIDEPPAACTAPRLLDQRVDDRLELATLDGVARARRAGRSGDGHGVNPGMIALVLLAS